MATIDLPFLQQRTDNGFAGSGKSLDLGASQGKLTADRHEATTKMVLIPPVYSFG